MKFNKTILIPILLIVTIGGIFLTLLIANFNSNNVDGLIELQYVSTHSSKTVNTYEKSYNAEATISAVGDLLIHSTVYNAAKTNDGYDFNPMLARVKEFLLTTDISIANQETMVGGTEIGLSTYPTFNTPYEVADALLEAGVDIVSIANNHTIDRGEIAVQNAIKHYEKIGMEYVGGYKDFDDQSTLRTITKNGLIFSFLSYTYGTNGIPIPNGKEYLVNLIDKEVIKKDVAHAKQNSDVVVVAMHWGVEYILYPNKEQEELANFLAGIGVDIVIGHHPHVLQPMEFIERKDGGKMFVIYSLGNFLSGQKWDYKDIGGVVQLRVSKSVGAGESKLEITVDDFIPTFVSQQANSKFHVVPLKDAASFGLPNAQAKTEEMMNHMYQWINNPRNR
ncbi:MULTISPECIES: CapA family protein [Bacillus]|uniref:CapA family protein n=1 Tax=Bacillus TaxID=1386 RepID=UPI000BB7D9C3|nr:MULTISPECIES: CapA family protein [Bacillus]